ncbi:MAG TPA: 1,4-alpha-glucan branching protein GlgB, partial [Roseiflexaceae bacterium]|nr:1,4-alpha-glucan branching protein GlgB [Roseiflexaceae bacterium]
MSGEHVFTSPISDQDLYLFNEGTHAQLYDKLGAHLTPDGTFFAVWAPNASAVFVMGDFNGWDKYSHPLQRREMSGIWEGLVAAAEKGTRYKYHIVASNQNTRFDKTDPYALYCEIAPQTASIVWDLEYEWNDADWMAKRARYNANNAPISIYEVHIGSWMRVPEEGNRSLNYRELGPKLAEYCKRLGFTHVEFLPVMEHPYYPSWGYQATGFFAPTSRFGTPQDFMALVECLHQNDIGVILDWVPSHVPDDPHGLGNFDGTHLYEHADPRQGYHPDWGSLIFNYGRHEVRSFLTSSACIWLDKYHVDGLRVDAVASMLYLDYSRKHGEWIPNQYGGRENIDAITFLRQLNTIVYERHPDVQTIAEESTAWPMVSRPVYLGGLGFGMKWDMGWMHDTLDYMQMDPVFRKYRHDRLTFRMLYAFTENFVLALSHDEVVHLKGSLLTKMPGDEWQKFANLRLLFGYMIAQPGKKLLFMGGEIGQWSEWSHDRSLDWHLLDYPLHSGLQRWVADVNALYSSEPVMHLDDFSWEGFEWLDVNDAEQSIVSLMRKSPSSDDLVIAACNFTPVPRYNYRIGAPRGGVWSEVLNSDAMSY